MFRCVYPFKNIDRAGIDAGSISHTDIEINGNTATPDPEFIGPDSSIGIRILGPDLDRFGLTIVGRHLLVCGHEVLGNVQVNISPLQTI